MQLRSAACDVECWNPAFPQNLNDQLTGWLIHHLAPGRAGVDMTMDTGLIAPIPQIDLKRPQCSPRERGKICVLQ
jgi:hypothetical protein